MPPLSPGFQRHRGSYGAQRGTRMEMWLHSVLGLQRHWTICVNIGGSLSNMHLLSPSIIDTQKLTFPPPLSWTGAVAAVLVWAHFLLHFISARLLKQNCPVEAIRRKHLTECGQIQLYLERLQVVTTLCYLNSSFFQFNLIFRHFNWAFCHFNSSFYQFNSKFCLDVGSERKKRKRKTGQLTPTDLFGTSKARRGQKWTFQLDSRNMEGLSVCVPSYFPHAWVDKSRNGRPWPFCRYDEQL